MLRVVAGAATCPGVFAIEDVSGLRVVKSLRSRVPVNHLEVDAVVIGMAFYAGRSWGRGARESGMKASVLLDLGGNFLVTLETAKLRCPRRHRVTLDAIRIAIQALVHAGNRSRGYLRMGSPGKAKSKRDHRKYAERWDRFS